MFKGWLGEKKTALVLWWTLDSKVYRRHHNVIVPSKNGTAQIDHIVVSPFGIFIVETKNIRGWIFGDENQPEWTQALYRRRHTFQNPIRQVYRQKKALSVFLGIDEKSIRTVIYFVGDCTFKTEIPEGVIRSRLGLHIKQFRTSVLSSEEIDQVQARLKELTSEPSLTTKSHIRSLRERYSSNSVCPKCGSNLVERVARHGPNTGNRFLGCEGYPKCRFTKDIEQHS